MTNARIEMLLEEVSGKLDKIISLLKFSNIRGLNGYKKKVFGVSEIREQVYDLCDGSRSVGGLAKILNKSISHISMVISDLEKAGLIESKRKGKEKYYKKVL